MPRARRITPQFFLDEDLGKLLLIERLLFAGLCYLADREGRLAYKPAQIKAQILPSRAGGHSFPQRGEQGEGVILLQAGDTEGGFEGFPNSALALRVYEISPEPVGAERNIL